MELIKIASERVKEMVNKSFADKFTEFNIRVVETPDIKNIRLNITTEFNQEIIITLFSSTVKETPFIAFDKGKYPNSQIMSIEIGLNPAEDKQVDELIMLKNILPGLISGIIK